MSYSISNLHIHTIQKKKYLFDSNLWLLILKPNFNLNSKQLKYLDFFEKFKNSIHKPKIIVLAIILSEVINRYLRDVSMKRYARKHKEEITQDYFKTKYRLTDDYRIEYELLCDEIKSFHNYCELTSDEFGSTIKFKDLLKSPPKGLDFNDNIICQIAKKNGYTIVTEDSDFYLEDVEILTLNQTLLNK